MGDLSAARETQFVDHFAEADRLLEPFDAILLDARSLAIARYHLFPAHPEAGHRITDWFYDWVDPTPDAISPFLCTGFNYCRAGLAKMNRPLIAQG